MIPVSHNEDTDVRDLLNDTFSIYQKYLDELDAHWLFGNKFVWVRAAKEMCEAIIECIDCVYSGNHFKAFKILDEQMVTGQFQYPMPIKDVGSHFYRMRLREKNKRFTHKDMFHIPESKRHLVKTQRFSMPGLPCLYLGDTAYACWEEMHQPTITDCMVSRFEAIEPIKVLSLVVPSLDEFTTEHEYIKWIRCFPLILASMVTVRDYNYPYKAAYIIPQLLMEWLLATDLEIARDVKGIYYTSVHLSDEFTSNRNNFNCLALPVPGSKSREGFKPLNKLFKLTDPTCDEYLRIKYGNYISESSFEVNKDGHLYYYSHSVFDDIESWLKKEDAFPLRTIEDNE